MRQETWVCDICGKTINRIDLMQINIPQWCRYSANFEQSPRVQRVCWDLCESCARDLANVLYDNFNIGEKE